MDEKQRKEKIKRSCTSLAILIIPWIILAIYLTLGCFCISFFGLSAHSCPAPNIFCKFLWIITVISFLIVYLPFVVLLTLVARLNLENGFIHTSIIIIVAIIGVIYVHYLTKLIWYLIDRFKK